MYREEQSEVSRAIRDLTSQSARLGTTFAGEFSALKKTIIQNLDGVQSELNYYTNTASGLATELTEMRTDRNPHTNTASELATKLTEMRTTLAHRSKICQILGDLRYPSINDRHSQIAEAHRTTFEWIFDPDLKKMTRTCGPSPTFNTWLQSDEKLFWVTGKPGSGKSTLMKWLYSHNETKQRLQTWAGSNVLVIASHFFWYAGTDIQKSQTGLLQSLLFDALRGYNQIIPKVVGDRWVSSEHDDIPAHRPWTFKEASESFSRLAKLQDYPVRFCFCVDGLDEYYGDHEDLIELLQDTARSNIIKLCVSSRPWNVFQEAFGGTSEHHLKLEDLTKDDIAKFVEDRLCQHQGFRVLQREDPKCAELITEIRDAAQGVFLWVFLVVRSLLRGLSNADTVAELQKRLRLLPKDLEKLFNSILDATDQVYHQQQAKLFFTARHAHEPLSLMTYSYIDELDPNTAIHIPKRVAVQRTSLQNIDRLRRTKKRLNAHCNGLLECYSSSNLTNNVDAFLTVGPGGCFLGSSLHEALSRDIRVTFLHRTVRDFIATKEMDELLQKRAAFPVQPSIWICHALLAELRAAEYPEICCASLKSLGLHAHESEVRHGLALTDILNDVESLLCSRIPSADAAKQILKSQDLPAAHLWLKASSQLQKSQPTDPQAAGAAVFVCFVLQNQLTQYFEYKLKASWKGNCCHGNRKALVDGIQNSLEEGADIIDILDGFRYCTECEERNILGTIPILDEAGDRDGGNLDSALSMSLTEVARSSLSLHSCNSLADEYSHSEIEAAAHPVGFGGRGRS